MTDEWTRLNCKRYMDMELEVSFVASLNAHPIEFQFPRKKILLILEILELFNDFSSTNN